MFVVLYAEDEKTREWLPNCLNSAYTCLPTLASIPAVLWGVPTSHKSASRLHAKKTYETIGFSETGPYQPRLSICDCMTFHTTPFRDNVASKSLRIGEHGLYDESYKPHSLGHTKVLRTFRVLVRMAPRK